MASSTLLQLGQNIERLECKNRESVYLLLHMVTSTAQYELCFQSGLSHWWLRRLTSSPLVMRKSETKPVLSINTPNMRHYSEITLYCSTSHAHIGLVLKAR